MRFQQYNFLCCVLFLLSGWCTAQINIKVYHERVVDGYLIYAENNEFCPASIQLDFTLKNLRVVDKKHIYLIPATEKKFLLTAVNVIQKNKGYSINYNYFAHRGNHLQQDFDQEYTYGLPYQEGERFILYQGYQGTSTHQGKNALDFTMPIGTPITAIRDGVVIKVVEGNSKSCKTPDCQQFNNYITIYHEDGTFAEYAHIKKDGAIPNPGDRVKQGEVIGYSGNVGYSSGPHLHLEIFLQKMKKRQTLKTKFHIDSGQMAVYLKEKNVYAKEY